jgi:glutamyl-tRNA synthetase
MNEVRTRFAPSPTGYLHVGGIRTALFAWLLARQINGAFILRFEDTDKKREVEGAKEHLIECLLALGLNYDEGPDIGGDYGPYVQSERLDKYRTWALTLIKEGRAYADPYSQEELQKLREDAQANKLPFLYRNHRPAETPEWDGTMPLRFKSDPKPYEWTDAVMGDLSSSPEAIDDFILIKSDGYPTYNFAHIVDDYEMKISHVLRGQEFLSSIPNYLNLYEALNFEKPVLATLPHVLAPGGKKKLSKRDGAKDVLDYIKQGYFEESLVSFIATLGWNDGTTQEIYNREELIEKFSLGRVHKSGANFDEKRLEWINGTIIRSYTLDNLYARSSDFWPKSSVKFDDDYKKSVLGILQDRLKYMGELTDLTGYFFEDYPINPSLIDSNKQLKKLTSLELLELLEQASSSIKDSDFSVQDLQDRLNNLLEKTGQKPAVLFSLIRIATTQAPNSPGLAETMAVLGKDKSCDRIEKQIEALKSN